MVPKLSVLTTTIRVVAYVEFAIGKTNTPSIKESLLASIKKINTLVLQRV